jgi:hypothetical protein
MALVSEEQIRRSAAAALARALRRGIVCDQSTWVWQWLDRNGLEPVDLRAFTRSVIARARRAVPAQSGCTGYGPDPERAA